MTTTRVFQNGNSQALRIPQEMRTDKKEFCISKIRFIALQVLAGAVLYGETEAAGNIIIVVILGNLRNCKRTKILNEVVDQLNFNSCILGYRR